MLDRRGFTLVEIVIAIGIIALLSGVLIPQLFRRADDAQSTAMLQNISTLVTAITGYRADVGRYPSTLVLLTTAPTATSVDLCNRTVPDYSKWAGPYLDRSLTSSGLPTGTALIGNALSRDPENLGGITTAPANLVITATDVERNVALAMDAQLDGDGALTTGSVRWTVNSGAPGGTRGSLFYRFPMRGC